MSLEHWLRAVQSLVRTLLGNPGSRVEMGMAAALAWLVFIIVQTASSKALGLSRSNWLTSTMVSLLGFLLIVVGMAAARLYLPQWQNPAWRVWILVSSGVLVGLFLGIPLTCWIQKGGYIGALLSWVFGTLAAALMVILTGALFDGLAGGRRGAEKGVQHRELIEKALE